MSMTKEWLMEQEERSQPDWDEMLVRVDVSLDELARRIEALERRLHELGELMPGGRE
jgi:hypothetical protein